MKILKILSTDHQVFVQDLSREFGVSEVTIRNDLEQLEQKRLLIRARGGAMHIDHVVGLDQHLGEKAKLHHEEKNRIGQAAARLI
jgi:DeoR family transcriptional regulator of aga operon